MAIWNETTLEHHLERALKSKFGKEQGQEYMASYVNARKVLLDDLLNEIRRSEPDLTDHGPDHVRHVLENAFKLLQGDIDYFNPVELYVLGLSILFHDVGNVERRDEHNKRVARFYDHVREGPRHAHEKALIVQIALAHTGTARDGTANTLADVPPLSHLNGEPVKSRELAAVVRLADELAEGPNRTSAYLRARSAYPQDSAIHHDYAAATDIAIDRGNSRIAVTYQLAFRRGGDLDTELSRIKKLLQYSYERLAKMDLERRYARYHCPRPLGPFQKISVRLNVQIDGEFLDPSFEATISDEVNLNSSPDLLYYRESHWRPEAVAKRIRDKVLRRNYGAD